MKFISTSILFFCFIFLFGCDQNQKNRSSIFNQRETLKATLFISSDKLSSPWKLLCMDSLLIIGNKTGDSVFEIYNDKGILIAKCGHRGRNSLDLMMFGTIQPDFKTHSFYVYDLFLKKILRFDLKKILSNTNYVPQLVIDFNKSKARDYLFDKVNVLGSSFVAESKDPKGRIMLLNSDGSLNSFCLPYPNKIDSSLNDLDNVHLYNSQITISPDKNWAIMETNTAGIINIIKVTNTKLIPYWSYSEFLPNHVKKVTLEDGKTNVIAFTDSSTMGYFDNDVSDKYSFSLFYGKPMPKKNKNFTNTLRVLSWNTKIKDQFVLDRPINRLSIEQNNKTIYGLAITQNNEPEIVRYSIPNL